MNKRRRLNETREEIISGLKLDEDTLLETYFYYHGVKLCQMLSSARAVDISPVDSTYLMMDSLTLNEKNEKYFFA